MLERVAKSLKGSDSGSLDPIVLICTRLDQVGCRESPLSSSGKQEGRKGVIIDSGVLDDKKDGRR